MINKKKVINGLKCCAPSAQCKSCPYFTGTVSDCIDSLMIDALNLFTEQEEEISFLKAMLLKTTSLSRN